MQDLKITLIQSDLHWEDIEANLSMFEEKIWQINGSTDVIVLPEMFTTGFSMNASRLAEHMNMKTFKWMKQMADQTGALILGSFICTVHGRFYNRLLWMEPGGVFKTYDKRHLFRMDNEHKTFTPGESLLIGTWKGWRICPLICYDLRFPVWSRNKWDHNTHKLAYDLAIYVANWPMTRIDAWNTLLKARAIENISYVVGVNRVGQDENGVEYNGNSAIISPKGDSIVTIDGSESIRTLELNANALHAFRDRFPAYMDADDFTIEFEEYEEESDD
ncbi:amidohydrolase [Pseudochryseolinea flava]|uniref:Omega-amidase YafV n=1 Tax=Pseudochryseolinea flava TaxID=2059302 RepID=A0A364Y9F0_9BACT|nr:amidohydrolase [Pseudochryseolinea flava]RAW02999.1 amidohydrolase [Pseudochryseolinea flava]